MKRNLLTAASLLLGTAVLLASTAPRWQVGDPQRPLVATGGAVLVLIAVLAIVSRNVRGRTAAALRLDHFLPFLRKPKKNVAPRTPSLAWRWLSRLLPAGWLSDPVTATPGTIRRALRRIGPSLSASPARRAAQAVCLAAFLVLFHYVCWPYSARPASPPRRWAGFEIREFDQRSGRIRLTVPAALAGKLGAAPVPGSVVYLMGVAASDVPTASAGASSAVEVLDVNALDWIVAPRAGLTPELLDLVIAGGECSLQDQPADAWPAHYTHELARKEHISAELFLVIDPLVSLSTAVASRSWVWSLASAAAILLACALVPRGFCGYICPLGTLIDLFDTLVGRRVMRWRVPADGWWVHLKYYLLLGTMIAAMGGVLVSGFVAAIPIVTRGVLFLGDPLQTGVARGWHLVPPWNVGQLVSVVLFLAVLGLGFLQPRFWCRYVCPSGAVFSLGNLLRVTERKVEDTCIHCNKCVEICPFDAIKPDFTTRTTDCTLCQSCGGVCPTEAIKFVERWNLVQLKTFDDPPTRETPLGRRGFLALAAGTAASIGGGAGWAALTRVCGAGLEDPARPRPVRPPGSVPEASFLQLCIRCGECFKACPNNVLQPLGFEQGLEGLWTPEVVADWAGCESSCNACGHVCPTGAIRALPLAEKRVARMGLAIVNPETCLPFAGREACQLCVDECHSAGYHAIEFTRVHTQVDAEGNPVEGSGFLAPVVLGDKCVGCGLCQTRCCGINADQKRLLPQSAIVIAAGADREDRLTDGSYRMLRAAENVRRLESQRRAQPGLKSEIYLPDFLK